jgi:hypothetical protein
MSNEPEPVAQKGRGVVTRPTTGTVADTLERLLGVPNTNVIRSCGRAAKSSVAPRRLAA